MEATKLHKSWSPHDHHGPQRNPEAESLHSSHQPAASTRVTIGEALIRFAFDDSEHIELASFAVIPWRGGGPYQSGNYAPSFTQDLPSPGVDT